MTDATPEPAGECRAAQPEEADALLRVLCQSYQLPYEVVRPLFYADPYFDLSHKRLRRTLAGGIVSCLTVIPARLRVGAAWVPLAGIAGVATAPAQRGQGHATRLLTDTIPALFDELGYPLAGLFAESELLYRRIGWETVTHALRRRVPLTALPPSSPSEAHCFLTPQGLPPDAKRLQEQAACRRTGNCLRDDRRWRLVEQSQGRRFAVFQHPTEAAVSGYAIWDEQGQTLQVREIIGSDPLHLRSLLPFMARQSPHMTHLEWVATQDEWERAGLPSDEQTSVSTEPGLMLRIVDLQAALALAHGLNFASLLQEAQQSLTVFASDPLRPKNEIPLCLTPGGVAPGTATDAEWISAEIGTLSAIYSGDRTPTQAHALARLTASSEGALALADKLFPRRFPMMASLDYF